MDFVIKIFLALELNFNPCLKSNLLSADQKTRRNQLKLITDRGQEQSEVGEKGSRDAPWLCQATK